MGEQREKVRRRRKTAVVLIHRLGEQVPMEALRGFVEATWVTDSDLIPRDRPSSVDGGERKKNAVWGRPDATYEGFEHRRITTEADKNGRTCDFYELYWADLLRWTDWHHVRAWVADLLLRRPSRVPPRLFAAWIFLWIISLVSIGFLAWGFVPKPSEKVCETGILCLSDIWYMAVGLGGIALALFVNFVVIRFVADASRYLDPHPPNVMIRDTIRERGTQLLNALIAAEDDDGQRKYDRIIVVGHSLGAVIGYDLLKYCFARWHDDFHLQPGDRQPRRVELEEMLRKAETGEQDLNLDAFQAAQDRAREEYLEAGGSWIVSDFITLGSMLGHGDVILAYDRADLRRQQEERVLPTCPPTPEFDLKTGRRHWTFWPGKRRSDNDDEEARLARIPHHAAHFALTKWTNLYSPASWVLWGDVLSAPAAETFGSEVDGRVVSGIRDVPVLTAETTSRRFVRHPHYWDLDDSIRQAGGESATVPHHLQALRTALNFTGDKRWEDVR